MRPYNATFDFSEEILLTLIEQQLPNLMVNTVCKIGEGWDNYVYEINSTLIFRIPRRKVAVQLLEIES